MDNTKNLNKTARIAGILFLLSFIVPSLNWGLVQSKFYTADNISNIIPNILSHEMLFRFSIINEILIALLAVFLAFTFFEILKSSNKKIAKLGLIFRLIESTLLIVMAIGHFLALFIVKKETAIEVVSSEQLQTYIGLFLSPYLQLSTLLMIVHGLSYLFFFYVFLKSGYLPSILAYLGFVSYGFIVIYSFMGILIPGFSNLPDMSHFKELFFIVPSILSEVIIGLWLIIKGVKVESV